MAKTAKLIFHTPADASPMRCMALLQAMHAADIDTPAAALATGQLLELAEPLVAMQDRREPVQILRVLGLICGERQFYLSADGLALARLAEQDMAQAVDLAQVCYATAWDAAHPEQRTIAWSYAQASAWMWERAPLRFDTSTRKTLAEEMIAAIQLQFADHPAYQPGRISFRSHSLSGVAVWLAALQPPALIAMEQGDLLLYRGSCSPAALLLALAAAAKSTPKQVQADPGDDLDADFGPDIPLTPQRRSRICQACFLDPAVLDRLFDWMLPIYPQLITAGTTAGAYGRFVRLLRRPTLCDLIRNEEPL